MIALPSLALMILRRAQTTGAPWSEIEAEGPRYADAARLLVGLELCVVRTHPFKMLVSTKAGEREIARRQPLWL